MQACECAALVCVCFSCGCEVRVCFVGGIFVFPVNNMESKRCSWTLK